MSRSPSLVLSCTLMITPGGWALPTHPGSMFGIFLMPMASAWSAIEAQAERFGPEIDPRTSILLLPEWQQLLGPGPCGLDVTSLPLQTQQLLTYQRLTTRGGQSIPYFLSIAAAVGENATIQEATWSRSGMMRAGSMRTTAQGNQFMWQVSLAQRVVTLFRAGGSRSGDRLGVFSTSLAQCPISHAAPAHTVVSFNYSGTETH